MTSRMWSDGATERRGDGATETEGGREDVAISPSPRLPVAPSPRLFISLQQSRRINPINAGKIKTAEANGGTLLDAPENPIAAPYQSAPAQTRIMPALRALRHSACFLEAT